MGVVLESPILRQRERALSSPHCISLSSSLVSVGTRDPKLVLGGEQGMLSVISSSQTGVDVDGS